MGFRGIERVTGVHHSTVIPWVKLVGEQLPDVYDPEEIPEVGELDELPTFVGSKKNLDLDSSRALPKRYLRLGSRRPQWGNF